MASSRATIWALVDQEFSLQWCRKNIALPVEADEQQTINNSILPEAMGDFSDWAIVGEFVKQRSSNSEPINHIIKIPIKPQSLLDLAAAENQAQKSDQYQGLNR